MGQIGVVEEIWRYPVSSIGGERLTSADLVAGSGAIAGDRSFAIVDKVTGAAAKPETDARWRPALFLAARLCASEPEIGFADGTWMPLAAADLDRRLRDHFGFEVAIRPYGLPGCAMAANSAIAAHRYEPSPLHLVTSGALDWLAQAIAGDDASPRRFRPNLVLRTGGKTEPVEKAWLGQRLEMGGATLFATEETKRCGMTLAAQPGLPENPEILRSIVRQNRRNFGIYCTVEKTGSVSVGDAAFLVDARTATAG